MKRITKISFVIHKHKKRERKSMYIKYEWKGENVTMTLHIIDMCLFSAYIFCSWLLSLKALSGFLLCFFFLDFKNVNPTLER